MTSPILLTVAGVAQPAGSKKAIPTAAGWRVKDDAKHSRPWKTRVSNVALEQMQKTDAVMLDCPIALEVVFYIPRPKGHYGKRGLRPSAPEYPTTRPDATKLLRAVEDALTSICWRDDAQVVEQHVWKRYGEPARVEISIRPVIGENVLCAV